MKIVEYTTWILINMWGNAIRRKSVKHKIPKKEEKFLFISQLLESLRCKMRNVIAYDSYISNFCLIRMIC